MAWLRQIEWPFTSAISTVRRVRVTPRTMIADLESFVVLAPPPRPADRQRHLARVKCLSAYRRVSVRSGVPEVGQPEDADADLISWVREN